MFLFFLLPRRRRNYMILPFKNINILFQFILNFKLIDLIKNRMSNFFVLFKFGCDEKRQRDDRVENQLCMRAHRLFARSSVLASRRGQRLGNRREQTTRHERQPYLDRSLHARDSQVQEPLRHGSAHRRQFCAVRHGRRARHRQCYLEDERSTHSATTTTTAALGTTTQHTSVLAHTGQH